MAEHSRNIHGFTVTGDDAASKGMDYLDVDLQSEEARVFFNQARQTGSAKFEDDEERNFTLKYDRRTGHYSIEKRKASGWW